MRSSAALCSPLPPPHNINVTPAFLDAVTFTLSAAKATIIAKSTIHHAKTPGSTTLPGYRSHTHTHMPYCNTAQSDPPPPTRSPMPALQVWCKPPHLARLSATA
eukprot:227538-Chlamydomonas_euryale.AAC.1